MHVLSKHVFEVVACRNLCRECTGRKVSYEKSAKAFYIKLGGPNVEVCEDSEAFITNRVEMER